ncbi:MAG: hypothetical protein QG650_549 [Patescibacteria group bacterium]|nr:hypothetical protein [Patescibacteria group bacterium]
MKNRAIRATFASVALLSQIRSAFAEDDSGFIGGNGITKNKIRNGDFTFDDIPTVIMNATNFFLGFAATVSVVMIIYGAFRLSLGSVESDKDTAKKIIVAALIGFVLAVSSWAIIKIVMTNV